LKEDVNEDSDPQGEQDQTSGLTQIHQRHRHHNAVSKRRRPLCQGEIESLHRNEQNTEQLNSGKRWKSSERLIENT